jgi:hypothetical protein
MPGVNVRPRLSLPVVDQRLRVHRGIEQRVEGLAVLSVHDVGGEDAS